MRTLPFALALLAVFCLAACDSKPTAPPTPKTDASPAADAAKSKKDDSPTNTGY